MSKYGSRKTEVDGYIFDSKMEAARYNDLKLLERSGEIKSLIVHPVIPLVVNGKRIGRYIADFSYYQDDKKIVEDVKGARTAVYMLKKRLVNAIYGIEILET